MYHIYSNMKRGHLHIKNYMLNSFKYSGQIENKIKNKYKEVIDKHLVTHNDDYPKSIIFYALAIVATLVICKKTITNFTSKM